MAASSKRNTHTQHNNYRRWGFIYLLMFIDKASLHPVDEGVEGGSVILPCSSRNIVFEEEELTVHWRHNDTRNVYDIIHGKVSVKEQDPAYKNRAEVLPEEFKQGQIFLKLTGLRLSDTGTYLCFVPTVGFHHNTHLVVKERPVTNARAVPVRSHGTETSLGRSLTLILLCGFIVQIIYF